MADDQWKFKSRTDLRVLSLASVASVCISIVLVVIWSSSKLDESNTNMKTDRRLQNLKSSICASCHVFDTSRDHVSTNGKIKKRSLRDQSLCCVEEVEYLITLVDIMVMRWYMRRTVSGVQPVPSAHLYLDTFTDHDYSWSEEFGFGAAHVAKNLEFRNGRFVVKRSGLYNIYSSITFKREEKSTSSSTIVHSFRKLNSTRSVDVIERSTELPAQGETFSTSYLSGLVRLVSSDQLYVDVSHVDLIYRYAPANFIGLHLLK